MKILPLTLNDVQMPNLITCYFWVIYIYLIRFYGTMEKLLTVSVFNQSIWGCSEKGYPLRSLFFGISRNSLFRILRYLGVEYIAGKRN